MAKEDQCIYWNRKKDITSSEIKEIVVQIRALVEKNKDVVEIEWPEPKFNDEFNINFNGLGKQAHETFAFYNDQNSDPIQELQKNIEGQNDEEMRNFRKTTFNFCKTAGKPYEKVVKEALVIMQKVTKNRFDIIEETKDTADMNPKDWDKVVIK
jgi:hypothetical protein